MRGANPWIFSHAIERVEPATLGAGAMVEVCDAARHPLGYGHYHPATTIAVRMLVWGEQPAPQELLPYRLARALAHRQTQIRADSDCYRLVNGDGDGLSGLVVDLYGEILVVQILSAGMEAMRAELVAALEDLIHPRAIIERSQGAVRRQEGLPDRAGMLAGAPVKLVRVKENGILIEVDFEQGQKTGYFLDQRENRARFASLADGARVLDLCCYSGGFILAALGAGARRAVGVDTSARALGWARRNLELNGHPADRAKLLHAEAAKYLETSSDRFDLIVLDPPPLARSREQAVRAERLYVDLNAMAMRALAPGGHLMSFSCSVHFRGEDFVRAVRIAQTKARVRLRMVSRLGAGPDHPVLLGHVEGEYLTGLLLGGLD